MNIFMGDCIKVINFTFDSFPIKSNARKHGAELLKNLKMAETFLLLHPIVKINRFESVSFEAKTATKIIGFSFLL